MRLRSQADRDDRLPRLACRQERLRAKGIHRGIGLASFIELTNPSPFIYGVGGARISARMCCGCASIRMLGGGSHRCHEQGQGTEPIIRRSWPKVSASPWNRCASLGDTLTTPYGGGTGPAAARALVGRRRCRPASLVKEAALKVAGAMLQSAPDRSILSTARSSRRRAASAHAAAELSRIVYFRGDTLRRTCRAS